MNILVGNYTTTRSQLLDVSEAARSVGLNIHTGKTELMTTQPCTNLTLKGEVIKQATDFKYLGSMMASSESDVRRRRSVAWGAFWRLGRIRKSSSVNQELKLNIFKTACLPILLYGCETWILTKHLTDLNSYMYHTMYNVSHMYRPQRALCTPTSLPSLVSRRFPSIIIGVVK